MSANIKVLPQTKKQRTTAGQHPLPINMEDMSSVSRAGTMTSRPKRMSLFITWFIRHQAMSVTSRFYSQLVDFSGAINSANPWSALLGGPRWLWRKPTDVGWRTVKSSPVDVKGKGELLQKNHCVWVNFLHHKGLNWCSACLAGPLGDDDTLVHQPQDQRTPAYFRY